MGYYTNYTVRVDNAEPEIIEELRNQMIVDPFDEAGNSEESVKWYEHEEDMREFSKKFPERLFTLYGEGEENGDIWYKYFKNGKMQHCPAKITFDVFDETKLT